MPFLLFKYIAKRNVLYLSIVLIIVAAIIFIFDFMELVKLSYNTDLNLAVILKMTVMKNYTHVQRTFPFVFIISTILTYANLTRTFELIVARAYGMSIWQFIFPSVIVAFLFGAINICILNPIGSGLLNRYEKIEAIQLKGQPSTIAISSNGLWLRETTKTKNIVIHALRVSQETKELFDVTYLIMNSEYKFIRRIDAISAKLKDNNSWSLVNAQITDYNNSSEFKLLYTIPSKLNFLQIQESVVSPDTLSVYKLPAFIKTTQDSGFSVLRHLNHFYKIMISPFFYISMVLIGVIFATTLPRSGKSGAYIFIGILIGFLVYFVSDIINAIGLSGNVPIVFSALAPTMICLTIGLYLILHYEDG